MSRILIAALLLAPFAADAFAQGARSPARDFRQQESDARPATPPVDDRAAQLDKWFEALRHSPDPEISQMVQARIDAALQQSGSATADLLMTRARATVQEKDYDLSLELLNALIGIEPGFTEAYAQRATVYYLRKDVGNALADLRVAIAREPRHYTALSGLGVILQDIGQDGLALEAFRRAIAVHPHLKGVPNLIDRLEQKVEGREI